MLFSASQTDKQKGKTELWAYCVLVNNSEVLLQQMQW